MPLPVKDKKIQRRSMRDEVFHKLLTWIMEGTLRPGEKVVDKELAEHLGVSRTPVREALRRLEDKNLIESSANRWTRVAVIPSRESEMIYPLIWTLEELALDTAIPNLTPEDFSTMAVLNGEMEQALKDGNPVAASRCDTRFHDVFIRRSGNDHLIRMLEDLKIRCRRLEVNYFDGLSYENASIDEHRSLMEALKAKNPAQSKAIVHANWEKSLKRFRTGEALGKPQ